MEPKVHYRKHNSQQTVPILSPITPDHVSSHYILNIAFQYYTLFYA